MAFDPVGNITGLFESSNSYEPDPENWFQALPYSFIFNDPSSVLVLGGEEFYLPISPSNINIITHFATNVTSTIYGTVEEHTDVRYFDIIIKGTTGMAPRYINGGNDSVLSISPPKGLLSKAANLLAPSIDGPKLGRNSFQVTGAALGGLFAKTLSAVNSIVNTVSDIVGGVDNQPGLEPENSGYMAFHNFYQFLLSYKRGLAGSSSFGFKKFTKLHPLQFVSYKDGTKYDVVIKNFILERNAENPMLYFYSIAMRGYNLREADGGPSPDSASDILSALGLNGMQSGSILGKMKKLASKARSAAGSLSGGINSFGR